MVFQRGGFGGARVFGLFRVTRLFSVQQDVTSFATTIRGRVYLVTTQGLDVFGRTLGGTQCTPTMDKTGGGRQPFQVGLNFLLQSCMLGQVGDLVTSGRTCFFNGPTAITHTHRVGGRLFSFLSTDASEPVLPIGYSVSGSVVSETFRSSSVTFLQFSSLSFKRCLDAGFSVTTQVSTRSRAELALPGTVALSCLIMCFSTDASSHPAARDSTLSRFLATSVLYPILTR